MVAIAAVASIGTAILLIQFLPLPLFILVIIAVVLFVLAVYYALSVSLVEVEMQQIQDSGSPHGLQGLRSRALDALKGMPYSQRMILSEFRYLCAEMASMRYSVAQEPLRLSRYYPEGSFRRKLLENSIQEENDGKPVAMEVGEFLNAIRSVAQEMENEW